MRNIIPVLGFAICSACAMADIYLPIQGAAWRKTEAFSARQFSIGVLETAGRNRFDPRGYIIVDNFPVNAQTTYFTEATARAAAQAKAGAKLGVADTNVGIEGQREYQEKGSFVIFRTEDLFTLVDRMNDPRNERALARLKSEKKTPLIVTGTAVVFNNKISEQLKSNITANAVVSSNEKGAPNLTIGGGYEKSVTGSFSDGTVFAYEYCHIIWEESTSKPVVKRLEIDRPENPWF